MISYQILWLFLLAISTAMLHGQLHREKFLESQGNIVLNGVCMEKP